MKKTIIFASVALATLFAFSSCQKEALQDNESTNGVRIITAEFENNATKTELNADGKTPMWKFGDVIRILNATSHQDVTIKSGEDTPTNPGDGIIKNGAIVFAIPETMTGTLYAVYPASATTMTSCTDGNINFTIPAVQDGTFASANICVAKSMEGTETNKDNLVFSNATSVLEFSQTASSTKVLRVAVTAANAIAGKLTASFGTNNKAIISTDELTGKIIYTTAAATAQNKYYVAVAPVQTGAITFNYYKALEEKSESKTTKTLALNKIYALTIPTTTYEPSYVEIKMTVGGQEKTYKWAKCNIGATSETEFGQYFAWGYAEGCVRNTAGDRWVLASDNTTEKKFDTSCFQDRDASSFQDVATANWGGSWRMPTKEEFDALCKLTKEWKEDYKNSGVNGYLFTDKIFLPAAGFGYGTGLLDIGGSGSYWSSSLNTDNPFYLYFRGGIAYTNMDVRYYGGSVRALSE